MVNEAVSRTVLGDVKMNAVRKNLQNIHERLHEMEKRQALLLRCVSPKEKGFKRSLMAAGNGLAAVRELRTMR